jgi:hypothetical protein
MDFNIKLDGFNDLIDTLQKHSKSNLSRFEVYLTNIEEHAFVLEYGSTPGQDPWGVPGGKTKIVVDIFTGEQKIVSVQGYAMIRGNLKEAQKELEKRLSKIDLSKPVKPQLEAALLGAGAIWKLKAEASTPVDTGAAKAGWRFEIKK